MNKVLFEKIQNRLKETGLKFEANADYIFVGMDMDNIVGKVSVIIHILDDEILSYAVLSNKVPREQFNNVSEYLHRANYGLLYGNFEMDFSDGEVRYKLVTNCQDPGSLPNNYIDRSILLPCQMMEKYGKGIIQLMLNIGIPKDLIDTIEQSYQ